MLVNAANLANYQADLAELKSNPTYVEIKAALAAAHKTADQVDVSLSNTARNLDNTMTLNGRSY